MGKQLVNFITCNGESSAPYFVNYKAGRETHRTKKDHIINFAEEM
jgi:hypothetical protein